MSKDICLLAAAAGKFPSATAVIDNGRILTYRQLDDAVEAAARNLESSGCHAGSRIAIASENNLHVVILLNALWRIGAAACPVNPRFPAQYMEELLTQAGCSSVAAPKTSALCLSPNFNMLSLEETAPVMETGEKPCVERRSGKLPADRVAAIVFTSGTSGRPKAALLSYANFYYSALGSNENMPFKQGYCWLLSLPLYHVGGLAILFRAMLGGGAVALREKTAPFSGAAREYNITHVSLVSTQLYRILKDKGQLEKFRALKAAVVGGGPIPADLMRKASRAGMPVCATYGLTETASQLTAARPNEGEKSFVNAGRILEHRELKISADGEILARGKTLFLGYLSDDGRRPPADDEGWFHTGDLGELDRDGCLRVLGRKDNMFISGGENVQPEEIEETALRLFDFEQVVATSVEDEEFGMRPVAFIKGEFDAETVLAALRRSLPPYKIPIALLRWPVELEHRGSKPDRQHMGALARSLVKQNQTR